MLLVGSDLVRRFVTPMRPEAPKLMPARVSPASVGGTRTPEQGRRSRTRNTHRVRRMSTLPRERCGSSTLHDLTRHKCSVTSTRPPRHHISCPTAPRLSLATSTSDAPSPAEVNRRHTTWASTPETVPHGTNPQQSVVLGYTTKYPVTLSNCVSGTTKYPVTRCPLLGHLMP